MSPAARCRFCRHWIHAPESVRRGYGRDCAIEHGQPYGPDERVPHRPVRYRITRDGDAQRWVLERPTTTTRSTTAISDGGHSARFARRFLGDQAA
jgi:hypothetical protein